MQRWNVESLIETERKKGRKTIKAEPILKTNENDGMIDSISSAADKLRRMS